MLPQRNRLSSWDEEHGTVPRSQQHWSHICSLMIIQILKYIRSNIRIVSSFFLHVHRDMQLQLIDTTLKITPGSFPQSEYLTVCIIRITSSRQGVLFLKDMLRSLTPCLNVYIHAQSSELALCAPEFWCLDGLGIGSWKLAPIPNGIWHTGCAPFHNSEPSRSTVVRNRPLPRTHFTTTAPKKT